MPSPTHTKPVTTSFIAATDAASLDTEKTKHWIPSCNTSPNKYLCWTTSHWEKCGKKECHLPTPKQEQGQVLMASSMILDSNRWSSDHRDIPLVCWITQSPICGSLDPTFRSIVFIIKAGRLKRQGFPYLLTRGVDLDFCKAALPPRLINLCRYAAQSI